MKFLTTIIFLIIFIACGTGEQNRLTKDANNNHLKDYQQYALNRKGADADDQGFTPNDSFYLWSSDDFGKEFGKNRITKTYSDGFNRYTFWTQQGDTALIYDEDSISPAHLLKDTLFDVNGDNYKDFVITWNPNNGRCPPDFTMLFILDATVSKFKRIEAIDHIINLQFHPKEKTITSETICGDYKENYKFKWNKNFGLDTIYAKVTKL